jgi:LuxR family maltose regulon positive regulatory protein
MIELLGTKLFIPRPRKNLVSRPRLVERLNAGLDRKLTLIAAPAGFGKTTLLSEWIPQSPRCVTWFSLDEADNDSTRFWTYFIASIQQLNSDLGESALALLQSLQVPPITSILTTLINDISAFPDAFAIVMDDYHLIDSQAIHDALTFLIAHLPVNMHLVITTRIDPPLTLARLRARDKLTEIRANDLRFTVHETGSFLTREVGEYLTTEEIAALESRTEGWIAGLQIAALSIRGHDDKSGFIQAFSGSHRHILGYLGNEVLNQRPKGTLNFLLQTSILDRLCGPLCDAVTGESSGQATLENLANANLFITPLDDEGIWYRYHHLFAEVLRARLKEVQGDQMLELHRRAGDWLAQQGYMEESVRHALTGANFEEAANLIEHLAGDMLRKGSSSSLMRWLDAMPDEIIRIRPRLCLARGWTFLWGPTPHLDSVDQWAYLALQHTVADKAFEMDVHGEAAALQATTAAIRWDVARSRELATQALEHLPSDSPWRSVMTLSLGTAHFYSSDLVAATRVLEDALRLSQVDGANYIKLLTASFLAEIEVFQGNLGRAMERYQQVLSWSDHEIPQRGTIMAHSGLANILCEFNKLEDALSHLQLGIEQLHKVGGAWVAFELYRSVARVNVSQGNLAEALGALSQASESGQNAQVDFVATQVAALQACTQLAQGDLKAAESWARNSGLSPDDSEASRPGLREVEYLSYARVLNAQGKNTQAAFLLERLLQSAQTEERNGSVITILTIQALVSQAQDNTSRAFERLEGALTLAEPEGFLRTFIDEGEPMHRLLLDYQSKIKKQISDGVDSESLRLLAYTDKLLAAFSQTVSDQKPGPETMVESLSERELDILRLIATGRSNQEIADILVIAMSTVKSHINSIYGKLSTNRRTQAVALAHDMGLLSE